MDEVKEVPYELIRTNPEPETAPAVFQPYGGMVTPELLQKAELAVEGVKKIKAIAFRVTNERDWIRMGGNAYLTESGCKKVGMLFGVSYRDAKVMCEDRMEGGSPTRQYTAKVKVLFNGREIEEMGTCDSNYDLYRYCGKDAEGNRIVRPFEERDFTSMQKHALTNAMNRALKAILGLNGITWDEVQAAIGERAGKAANVGFDKGGTAAPKPANTVSTAESGDQRKKLWKMLLELANADQQQAAAILVEQTSFKGKDGNTVKGFSDPFNEKISDKWIFGAYGKIKKMWEASGFNGPPEPGSDG
jgi:hypothetical protein